MQCHCLCLYLFSAANIICIHIYVSLKWMCSKLEVFGILYFVVVAVVAAAAFNEPYHFVTINAGKRKLVVCMNSGSDSSSSIQFINRLNMRRVQGINSLI